MLEVMLWIAVGTAAFVVLGIFLIMIMIVLCGALSVFNTVVGAAAWLLEKIGNMLPDPAKKDDRQGID